MPYQPIENYGIIGNMRTVALVGMNGSIDWYCYPHFDSPSIFGALLDDAKGGRFQISPIGENVPLQAVLLALDQYSDNPLPACRWHRRIGRLHARRASPRLALVSPSFSSHSLRPRRGPRFPPLPARLRLWAADPPDTARAQRRIVPVQRIEPGPFHGCAAQAGRAGQRDRRVRARGRQVGGVPVAGPPWG